MEYPRFLYLCESAVVVEFGAIIDPLVNARVIALSAALEAKPFAGMRELVPAYASLTVYFDPESERRAYPGNFTWESVRDILVELSGGLDPHLEKGLGMIEVPVCYDPGLGTDLDWVASFCGLSPSEVIRVHSEVEYRVYMNGFIPGFAYLGLTDRLIEVPRRPDPMVVHAGSVALAGRQTGIYPASITGGWRVIGRTPLEMFDPSQNPAALLRPGMRVRFRPIDLDAYQQLSSHGTADR